jgi:hypothetical protein
MAPPNRKGGGGLSLQTLVIASAASVTAAMVTSRVAPAGTIYASALTPVIVAAVGELLSKPADRVSALREQRRAMVREARREQTARVLGEEPNPLRGAPEFAQGLEADEEHGFVTAASGNGHGADEALERIRGLGGGPSRRRILHPKVWIATGLAAFAIAVAVLTLPELIFGGAVATNHRTTIFGGATHLTSKPKSEKQQTQTTTNQQTTTTTVPTESTTTPTTTETTPTTTGEQTAPSGGTPAPQPAETQTTPTTTGAAPTP